MNALLSNGVLKKRLGMSATVTLAVVIAILTLAPMPASGLPGSDKVYHVLAFAALAFPMSVLAPRSVVWIFLGAIAYGGMIEVVQPLTGRSADWADLLADAFGAALGAGFGFSSGRGWRRLRERKPAIHRQ